MSEQKGLTYKDAGVDIAAGNALVERIKPLVARTARPEMLAGLGGFGGLMGIPEGYLRPVLVSGTDGVGTKLKLAQMMNRHDTIGVDLVAMCVNDVIVQGAEPLFFLDYFATGKLDPAVAGDVIAGIAAGCEQAGCALIGGETAEMPDMYGDGEYDLAGFNVGVAEYVRLVTGASIRPGDRIVGIDSSGIHSNGYSLVRRILEVTGTPLDAPFGDATIGEALLAPTRIYVRLVLEALEAVSIHGMAHITGGGLKENVIRVVPEEHGIEIDTACWQRPAVFDWLAEGGNVQPLEMLTTFNCGIGYVFIVPPTEVDTLLTLARDHRMGARDIGQVVAAGNERVRFSGLD